MTGIETEIDVAELKELPLTETITDDANYWICNKKPILDWLEQELAVISMRRLMININVKTGQRISISVLTSLENPHKHQIRGNTLLIILKYLGWDISKAIQLLQVRNSNVVSTFRRSKVGSCMEDQVRLLFLHKPELSITISKSCLPNSNAKYAVYQVERNSETYYFQQGDLLFIECTYNLAGDGFYVFRQPNNNFVIRYIYVNTLTRITDKIIDIESEPGSFTSCNMVLGNKLVNFSENELVPNIVGKVVAHLNFKIQYLS